MAQFSLRSLFEVFVAAAITLAAYGIGFPADESPSLSTFIPFYVGKLLLSQYVQHRKGVAVVSYSLLLLVMGCLGAYQQAFTFQDGFEFAYGVLYSLVIWYVVPTLTFVYDLFGGKSSLFRFLLWRSVFEILIACPVAYHVAIIVFAMILSELGVFPFA